MLSFRVFKLYSSGSLSRARKNSNSLRLCALARKRFVLFFFKNKLFLASLFPPAESSETWNHITVMNSKVGLSSDMGDEWSSQTARKEQSDNARWPQLSVKKLSFLSYCLQYARSCPCDWFFPSLAKASHASDLNFTT